MAVGASPPLVPPFLLNAVREGADDPELDSREELKLIFTAWPELEELEEGEEEEEDDDGAEEILVAVLTS